MTLLRTLRSPYAVGTLAGLTLVGTLAGCASTSDTGSGSSDSGSSDSSSSDSGSTDTGTGSTGTDSSASDSGSGSTYTDGTYTAEGSYQSPGGTKSIEVELTLEDGVVTDVTVTPEATDNQSLRYQNEFADGIAAVAVGENIDDLDVSRVAGSSLTSGGFNEAVETIKADAQA